jgi:hypothetical protein
LSFDGLAGAAGLGDGVAQVLELQPMVFPLFVLAQPDAFGPAVAGEQEPDGFLRP